MHQHVGAAAQSGRNLATRSSVLQYLSQQPRTRAGSTAGTASGRFATHPDNNNDKKKGQGKRPKAKRTHIARESIMHRRALWQLSSL
jgi:hypothetical protein